MPRAWIPVLVLAVAACGYRASPSQPHTPPIDKLVVAPANDTLSVGASVQLTATAYDAQGQVVAGVQVHWTSTNASIAAVDSSGVVRGVGKGQAQVSASASVSSAATVTVVQP